MGGEVFVGVRRSNGQEQCSLRWTNSMPQWLADPDFLSGGRELTKFLKLAKSTNKWPQSKLVKRIQPSEYGVILVDFQTHEILSRQDYTKVGEFMITRFVDVLRHELELAVKLQERGWIESILTGVLTGQPVPMAPAERCKFMQLCIRAADTPPLSRDQLQDHMDSFGGAVSLKLASPFQVDDSSQRARDCWEEIRSWVKARGWKSRCWARCAS